MSDGSLPTIDRVIDYLGAIEGFTLLGIPYSVEQKNRCAAVLAFSASVDIDHYITAARRLQQPGQLRVSLRRWVGKAEVLLQQATSSRQINAQTCSSITPSPQDDNIELQELLRQHHIDVGSKSLNEFFSGNVVASYNTSTATRLVILYGDIHTQVINNTIALGLSNLFASGVRFMGIEGAAATLSIPNLCTSHNAGTYTTIGGKITGAEWLAHCDPKMPVHLVGLENPKALKKLASIVKAGKFGVSEEGMRFDEQRSVEAVTCLDKQLKRHDISTAVVKFGLAHMSDIKRELRRRDIAYVTILPTGVAYEFYMFFSALSFRGGDSFF